MNSTNQGTIDIAQADSEKNLLADPTSQQTVQDRVKKYAPDLMKDLEAPDLGETISQDVGSSTTSSPSGATQLVTVSATPPPLAPSLEFSGDHAAKVNVLSVPIPSPPTLAGESSQSAQPKSILSTPLTSFGAPVHPPFSGLTAFPDTQFQTAGRGFGAASNYVQAPSLGYPRKPVVTFNNTQNTAQQQPEKAVEEQAMRELGRLEKYVENIADTVDSSENQITAVTQQVASLAQGFQKVEAQVMGFPSFKDNMERTTSHNSAELKQLQELVSKLQIRVATLESRGPGAPIAQPAVQTTSTASSHPSLASVSAARTPQQAAILNALSALRSFNSMGSIDQRMALSNLKKTITNNSAPAVAISLLRNFPTIEIFRGTPPEARERWIANYEAVITRP